MVLPATGSLTPIAPAERIAGVDIARGVALLGILLVNARFFFAPLAFAIDPTILLPGISPTTADLVAWSLVEAFCAFKFISLFSILFGFGLAMQSARAHGSGRSRWGPGLRRLALLLALGLVHGLVVWYGDILTLYAVLGVAVLACARLPARAVLAAAIGVGGLTLLASVGAAAIQWAVAAFPEPFDPTQATDGLAALQDASIAASEAASEAAGDAAPRGWQAMLESGFNVRSDIWMTAEIAAVREGPFLDAAIFRAANFAMSYIAALFGYGWHALSMMLLGVCAFRSGLFGAGIEASRRRRRIAKVGLAVGLPFAVAAPGAFWIWGFESAVAPAVHLVALEIGALVLPIAYACAIVEWGPRLPVMLATALERTGRMSLTVYLCESLVCVTLASWWGFGLFGTMSDARFTLMAPAVWAALVVCATLWLGHFRIGPMERLWRLATYARNPA